MADPHLLYIVSAVVVLGLVAWVIGVLARAPALPPVAPKPAGGVPAPAAPETAPAEAKAEAETKAEESAKGEAGEKAEEPAAPSKHKLDAHLEIHDVKPEGDKPGEG